MSSVVLYPNVEVLGGTPLVALRPLPVCQSIQCADKEPPMTIDAMLTPGMIGWTFNWGIEHGVGSCARCGAWHRLFHFSEPTEWWAECVGNVCGFEGPRRSTKEEARADITWHVSHEHPHGATWNIRDNRERTVYPELIDNRPEHYADGKVPEEVTA